MKFRPLHDRVVVKRIDADPRLEDFWRRRFPFAEGWDA